MLEIRSLTAESKGESWCRKEFKYSPFAWGFSHLAMHNQSGLKNSNTISFFPYQSLPLKCDFTWNCVQCFCVTITECTTSDGLKLIWMKTLIRRKKERERERWARRCRLCIETKKGAGERSQGETGQPEPVLHAGGGLLWEKELTGRRIAASSSQTTAAQKEETSWGCCDMSRSFSISPACLSPSHPRACLPQWHTHTHSHRHAHPRGGVGGGVRFLPSACTRAQHLKWNQVNLNFWWNPLFVPLTWKEVCENAF